MAARSRIRVNILRSITAAIGIRRLILYLEEAIGIDKLLVYRQQKYGGVRRETYMPMLVVNTARRGIGGCFVLYTLPQHTTCGDEVFLLSIRRFRTRRRYGEVCGLVFAGCIIDARGGENLTS